MLPDLNDHRRNLRAILLAFLVLAGIAVVFLLVGCSPLGTMQKKIVQPPAAPMRTQKNEEDAKKVAGAITDSARAAHQRGLVAQSTSSGTLVALAETNETYVGSPDKRVSPDDVKSIVALIDAMQRQEARYREDRAAWEVKIDAMSRERDAYKTEVTAMGGIIAKLKFWLTLGLIALAVACVFVPGLWLFLVKFVVGRAKAQFVTTVQGIQDFREANRDVAPKLDAFLKARQDNDTQNEILDIKARMKKRRAA